MECSACGAELLPGARYCTACSAQVEGATPPPASPGEGAAPPFPSPAVSISREFQTRPLPSGNDPAQMNAVKELGWNWGGFLLPYLWLIGHGRLTTGLLLTLSMCIPFVAFVHVFAYPATAIYLGLNGFENAWRYKPFHSVRQLDEGEKEWAVWGLVCNVVILFSIVFFMIYMGSFVEEAWREMETMGW